MTRPELSYDGHGINGPDEYRSRLFTANGPQTAERRAELDRYGRMFAAAPDMLEVLTDIAWRMEHGHPVHPDALANVESDDITIREAVNAAIAAARGEE